MEYPIYLRWGLSSSIQANNEGYTDLPREYHTHMGVWKEFAHP